MNDQMLQAQVSVAFAYPIQTLLFLVGSAGLIVGMLLAALAQSEKWKQRGLALAIGAAFVAMPAVLPMALQFVGEGNDDIPYFDVIYNALVYVCPMLGLACVLLEWNRSNKLNTAKNT